MKQLALCMITHSFYLFLSLSSLSSSLPPLSSSLSPLSLPLSLLSLFLSPPSLSSSLSPLSLPLSLLSLFLSPPSLSSSLYPLSLPLSLLSLFLSLSSGVQDDTLAVTSPTLTYARSVSAPPMTVEISTRWVSCKENPNASTYFLSPLRRQRGSASHSKKTLLDISASHDKSNLLDQIFQFIGTKPEEAVSGASLW